MIKIKYHISGMTDIRPSVVTERILARLDKPGYVLLEKTSEAIEFKYNIWRIGSRTKVLDNVDGGRFGINIDSNSVLVNFDYYVSLDF